MGHFEKINFNQTTTTVSKDNLQQETACWLIGGWLLIPEKNLLTQKDICRQLEPKAVALLVYLARHRGRSIPTQELLDKLWPDIAVSDNSVRRIIAQLRKAFEDDAGQPRYIATVARKGYHLIASAEMLETSTDSSKNVSFRSRPWKRFISAGCVVVFAILWLISELSPPSTDWLEDLPILQFTSLPGRELSATFSPDGKAVIFAYASPNSANYALHIQWLGKNTSQPIQGTLGNPFNSAWSPDGSQLAYTNLDGCQVVLARLAPDWLSIESQTVVFSCDTNTFSQLAWSNDGLSLFINNQQANSGVYQQMRYELATAELKPIDFGEDLPGNGFVKLLPHPSKNLWALKGLENNQNAQIWLFDPESRQKKLIINSDRVGLHMDWCGKDDPHLLVGDNQQLLKVDIDGNLQNLPLKYHAGFSYLACAPDGQSFVFSDRQRHFAIVRETNPRLTRAEQKRSNYAYRSSRSEWNPVWANRSKKLGFVSDRTGQWQVWSGEGDKASLVSQHQYSSRPYLIGWSTDDSQLLLLSQNRLAIINVSNGQQQWLGQAKEQITHASWGADGEEVYFTSGITGQIYRQNVRNQKIIQLTQNGGVDMAASSDGKYLYFSRSDKSGLWRQDLVNQQQELIIENFVANNLFQLVDHGIYFHAHNDQSTGLYFYDFKNKNVETVFEEPSDLNHDFSVSADESEIAFTVIGSYQSDLKIIKPENN